MSPEQAVPEFWQAVEQFNRGEFYACHDRLEALWIEAVDPDKTFYQAILQLAVACYHLGNGNLRGATLLLGEGINRLRRYPADYGGIDLDQLLLDSRQLLDALQYLQHRQTEVQPLPASLSIQALAI